MEVSTQGHYKVAHDAGESTQSARCHVTTIGLTLVNDVRGYGVGKFLGHFLAPEQRKELSDEDIARVARAVIDINEGKIAKAPVQAMYKQLERDTNIESVGATTRPDDKPVQPIPRSAFLEKAGIAPLTEISTKTRTIQSTERLTLISPVLLPNDRVWRFRSPIGEFGYFLKDEKFLNAALNGTLRLGLKKGIQITAQIETKEEFEGGVWVQKRREIIKVVRVHRQPEAEDLFAQPSQGKKGKSKPRNPKSPQRLSAKVITGQIEHRVGDRANDHHFHRDDDLVRAQCGPADCFPRRYRDRDGLATSRKVYRSWTS